MNPFTRLLYCLFLLALGSAHWLKPKSPSTWSASTPENSPREPRQTTTFSTFRRTGAIHPQTDQAIGHHDNFELIFISGDRNERAMKKYMAESGMNWLARAFDERRSSEAINALQGNGIPQLVVLDKHGTVLADSYEQGEYVGPYQPLEKFIAMLHD